jgi:hypothetical protein
VLFIQVVSENMMIIIRVPKTNAMLVTTQRNRGLPFSATTGPPSINTTAKVQG